MAVDLFVPIKLKLAHANASLNFYREVLLITFFKLHHVTQLEGIFRTKLCTKS